MPEERTEILHYTMPILMDVFKITRMSFLAKGADKRLRNDEDKCVQDLCLEREWEGLFGEQGGNV